MTSISDLPDSPAERAAFLENIMIGRATGDQTSNDAAYRELRREFMSHPSTKGLLPAFVRTCRSLDTFWPWIKGEAGTYAERRQIIGEAFTPLIDHLEGANRAPIDGIASASFSRFDAEMVHAHWMKALDRRIEDPEGAITIARTLLESVCKRILDEQGATYTGKEDLPKLYRLAASSLSLSPDQHSEDAFKAILGGCQTVVNGLGTLRNRLSDAHGRGGKPVRPAARHAALAVNLAGAMATFLIETWIHRQSNEPK